jgi:hypothetical protein
LKRCLHNFRIERPSCAAERCEPRQVTPGESPVVHTVRAEAALGRRHLFSEAGAVVAGPERSMTPQEFAAAYPKMLGWIHETLASYRKTGRSVASMQFARLPLYFDDVLLQSTHYIAINRVPIPPLSTMGLERFAAFLQGDPDGIAYLNTYFLSGVPQGGVISPLLSNLYLTEVDSMLERAKETTRFGEYTYIEYARFADDLVILIDAYPRHDWLMAAVEKRLVQASTESHFIEKSAKSNNTSPRGRPDRLL